MRIIPRRFAPQRLDFGEEAPLVDHLGELRHRIVFALISLVVTFSVTYAFRHHVIGWLEHPLPVGKRDLVTLSPTEPFITSLMVSLYAAFLLSFPVIVYQVWAFFAPALNPKIQRGVVAMTAFATMLGALGLAFGYYVALPAAVKFLTSYDDSLYDIQIRARDYFSFATTVLIAVTVVFELPIVILGLVMVRVLSYRKLKKNRRLGYVIMAAIAVALPGIDPITTTLEMIPLLILFESSIWIAYWMERRRKKNGEGDDDGGGGFEGFRGSSDPDPEPDPEPDEPLFVQPLPRDERERDEV